MRRPPLLSLQLRFQAPDSSVVSGPKEPDPIFGLLAPLMPLHGYSLNLTSKNPKKKTFVDLSAGSSLDTRRMRVLTNDVTKLFLYVIACFLLAALLTPWLYNVGTFVGEISKDGTRNQAFDWLGQQARNADFPTFFKRALFLSALLLVFPLIFSLRMRGKAAPLQDSPWSIYLPKRAIARSGGQRLTNPRSGWFQLLVGFVLAAGLLFTMGWLLLSLGWYTLKDPVPWSEAWRKAVVPAISASVLEEVIFRGVLLGICLRTFRPSVAIVLLSLLFAALHFLQPTEDIAVFLKGTPAPEGALIIDPANKWSGFQLLQAIALQFQHFDLVLFGFLSLTAIGLILGFARYATASLWLPIGLHAGWIFAYLTSGHLATRTTGLDESLHLLIGDNLKEGFVPLATLAVTAGLVCLFTRMTCRPRSYRDPRPEPLASEAA